MSELEAVQAQLETLAPGGRAVPSFRHDAGSALPPYTVVWGGIGLADREEYLSGSCGEWTAPFGITCTGQNADAADALAQLVLGLLWPAQLPHVVPGVEGRHVTVDFYDVRPVEVDRSLTLTTTNTHPAYVVLLGDLKSQPL